MLLWVNTVTDGLPALAVDAKADDVLEREPRDADEPVIDRTVAASALTVGAFTTLVGLPLFFYGLVRTRDVVLAQTHPFTFVVVVGMPVVQIVPSRYDLSVLSNRRLVAAVVGSFLLQLAVLYAPLADLFDVRALGTTARAWLGAAALGSLVLGVAAEWFYERGL